MKMNNLIVSRIEIFAIADAVAARSKNDPRSSFSLKLHYLQWTQQVIAHVDALIYDFFGRNHPTGEI